MEFTKKQPALLYLDKNGFYFFAEGLPSVLSLAFAPNAVANMDVINSATLEAQIKSFVEQYHITPSIITIILSPNVTFEKDIVDLAFDAQEEAVNKFIDTIPFDSVLSRKYPINKGVKVIGCNDDMYIELRSSFEKNACIIESVIPYQVLDSDQTLIKNLTTDNASQFLKRNAHVKQLTMLSPVIKVKATTPSPNPSATPSTSSVTFDEKPKKNNTKLFAMIGVFAVLLAVLGYMLVKMK